MITLSDEKYPSDPVSRLFEFLFSAILNDWVLYFHVKMIRNELSPLVFSHHCFKRPKIIFLLAWPISAAVGSI